MKKKSIFKFRCFMCWSRRDVPVGVPLDLSLSEWHELPKYNGIQVSQLILCWSRLCHFVKRLQTIRYGTDAFTLIRLCVSLLF